MTTKSAVKHLIIFVGCGVALLAIHNYIETGQLSLEIHDKASRSAAMTGLLVGACVIFVPDFIKAKK
jgi:hypothetical protein